MTFRRMLPFLLLNIVVSAAVVLSILYWWNGRQVETLPLEQVLPPTAAAPTVQTAIISEAESTPNPTAAAEEGPTTYVVQPGDTLGSISTIFDIPLEDLMAANGIVDPNFLQVDQELIIPIGGLATTTPEIVATETSGAPPSPIPTEPLTQGEAIVEISEVIGAGSLTEEAISIVNTGSRPIALENWQLVDEDGFTYTFGQITLFGDGAGVLVHTEAGSSTALDLYWGLEEAIWEPGETVRLLNAEQTEQASFVVPEESQP